MMEILRHIDLWLFNLINHSMANSFLDVVCVTLRDKKFLIFCYLIFAYRIYKLYPKHFLFIVIAGAVTFLITDQTSAHLVKSIVHRLRPCNNPEINARLLIEHCGSGFSFISAHATNSFGMAAFLTLIEKKTKIGIILGIWALAVSFSQVYVGVHFPADVAGGALVGVLIGIITASVFKRYYSPLKD